MRLLTHNVLRCNARGVDEGFPLKIEAEKVEIQESPFQADLIRSIAETLHWGALCEGAKALGVSSLPETLTPELLQSEDFLKAIHHVVMDVHLVEGKLHCPDGERFKDSDESMKIEIAGKGCCCALPFPVTGGIPNMKVVMDEKAEKDGENAEYESADENEDDGDDGDGDMEEDGIQSRAHESMDTKS
eukprot:CAMPEP_0113945086 /NCGR_PEP_ID=MMETSP1339-20121228/38477_1 /TAXON_ID=94617 /ORGANISM="Fibrocapsa japonica" /LENGTH=187 /DNA_ID=CAMNT_0000950489 /DNA_START=53 /DNA_END=616 /DNA_ORIENTATION=- /assembly_acc=CAM_ASM_000762